jgi:hypothetical protein
MVQVVSENCKFTKPRRVAMGYSLGAVNSRQKAAEFQIMTVSTEMCTLPCTDFTDWKCAMAASLTHSLICRGRNGLSSFTWNNLLR